MKMRLLLKKLGISVNHLICLDSVFSEHHDEYKRINEILNSEEFLPIYTEISRQLYAGGKNSPNSKIHLNRQMILGDIIEYIFTGRAYYYAAKSEEKLINFFKLILYSVNQMLLFDVITVNPDLRNLYINKLEKVIDNNLLYEQSTDNNIAKKIKKSKLKIWDDGWKKFDAFIDSILPKTLGTPKELVVFAEFIRQQIGIVVPLLLIQRIFGNKNPIAPPDFLILKSNKEIYGIEVGYKKELQSREFSIRTSIPTFAVDLKNNMHNRCPICGENILYCDIVINNYANNTLEEIISVRNRKKRVYCYGCKLFNDGKCKFSNYYGRVKGTNFNNKPLKSKSKRHYHTCCVIGESYLYRHTEVLIAEKHKGDFFAQIPEIDGIENLI